MGAPVLLLGWNGYKPFHGLVLLPHAWKGEEAKQTGEMAASHLKTHLLCSPPPHSWLVWGIFGSVQGPNWTRILRFMPILDLELQGFNLNPVLQLILARVPKVTVFWIPPSKYAGMNHFLDSEGLEAWCFGLWLSWILKETSGSESLRCEDSRFSIVSLALPSP